MTFEFDSQNTNLMTKICNILFFCHFRAVQGAVCTTDMLSSHKIIVDVNRCLFTKSTYEVTLLFIWSLVSVYLTSVRSHTRCKSELQTTDFLPWCMGCSWREMAAPAELDNRSPSSSTWRRHTPLLPPDAEADLETKTRKSCNFVHLKSICSCCLQYFRLVF